MPSARALEIKRRMREGEIVYSGWLTFPDVGVAEVLAGAGFDIVLIDNEHTSMTLESLEACHAAMKRFDPVTIVRVPSLERAYIKRLLDIGVDGVIVPMVMDAEMAKDAVAACKYPPLGRRGFGPRRASDYFRNMDAYVRDANEASFVIVQIEHIEAAARAEAIAAVPGLDVICMGPMDLSLSAGLLGQLDHPTVKGALDRIFRAAAANGLPVCLGMSVPPEDQPGWVAKGARLVIAADDITELRNGVDRALAATRRLLG
jgi:2-keto-3-deoxy-L-rhamnonate aldolase RhmA